MAFTSQEFNDFGNKLLETTSPQGQKFYRILGSGGTINTDEETANQLISQGIKPISTNIPQDISGDINFNAQNYFAQRGLGGIYTSRLGSADINQIDREINNAKIEKNAQLVNEKNRQNSSVTFAPTNQVLSSFQPLQSPPRISPLNAETPKLLAGTNEPASIQGTVPTNYLEPGQRGDNVKALQNFLIQNGYKIPSGATGFFGPETKAAVTELQNHLGINAGQYAGYFGPQTISALNVSPTAPGRLSGTPLSLSPLRESRASSDATSSPSIPSSVLSSGLSTADVLNNRASYEDLLKNYLQQIQEAQANSAAAQQAEGNLQAQNVQAQANILGSDKVAPLNEQDLAQLARKVGYEQIPLQLKQQNAQLGLQLAQSGFSNALQLRNIDPSFLNEQQARDTAYGILKTHPDIGIQYNPAISAQDNLAAIQRALPHSAIYQKDIHLPLNAVSTNISQNDPILNQLIQNPNLINSNIFTPTTRQKYASAMASFGINIPQQLSAEQQKNKLNAESGISALDTIQNEIDKNQNILATSKIPFVGQVFKQAQREASDVVTRLRTGAALNTAEQSFYGNYVPGLLDFNNPTSIQYKINTLRSFYQLFSENPQDTFPEIKKKLAKNLIKGEILVQNIKTGQFGGILEKEYDPNTYLKLTY